MNDSYRNVFPLFLLKSFLLCWCFCHKISRESRVWSQEFKVFRLSPLDSRLSIIYFLPGAFFFATAALRGPFRVLAFVEVRWPRTGKPRLCRKPR